MSKDKRFNKREYLFDGDEDYNDSKNKRRSSYKSNQDNVKADYSYQRRLRQQTKALQPDR